MVIETQELVPGMKLLTLNGDLAMVIKVRVSFETSYQRSSCNEVIYKTKESFTEISDLLIDKLGFSQPIFRPLVRGYTP